MPGGIPGITEVAVAVGVKKEVALVSLVQLGQGSNLKESVDNDFKLH